MKFINVAPTGASCRSDRGASCRWLPESSFARPTMCIHILVCAACAVYIHTHSLHTTYTAHLPRSPISSWDAHHKHGMVHTHRGLSSSRGNCAQTPTCAPCMCGKCHDGQLSATDSPAHKHGMVHTAASRALAATPATCVWQVS